MRKAVTSVPARICEQCSAEYMRPRFPSGKMQPVTKFGRRRFCGNACAKLYAATRPLGPNTRYRTVKRPERHCGAHRFVVEQAIGRQLVARVLVLVVNDFGVCNRIENLEVLSHAEHARLHKQKHPYKKPCVICGAMFTPHPTKRARAKTCGPECLTRLARMPRAERAALCPQVAEAIVAANLRGRREAVA